MALAAAGPEAGAGPAGARSLADAGLALPSAERGWEAWGARGVREARGRGGWRGRGRRAKTAPTEKEAGQVVVERKGGETSGGALR